MLTMKFFDEVKEMRRLQIAYRYGANMLIRSEMLSSQESVDRMIRQIDVERDIRKDEQDSIPGLFEDDPFPQGKM